MISFDESESIDIYAGDTQTLSSVTEQATDYDDTEYELRSYQCESKFSLNYLLSASWEGAVNYMV